MRTWVYRGGEPDVAVQLLTSLSGAGERVVLAGAATGAADEVSVFAWGGAAAAAWSSVQEVLAGGARSLVVYGDPDAPTAAAMAAIHGLSLVPSGAGAAGLLNAAARVGAGAGPAPITASVLHPGQVSAARPPSAPGDLLRRLAGERAGAMVERRAGLAVAPGAAGSSPWSGVSAAPTTPTWAGSTGSASSAATAQRAAHPAVACADDRDALPVFGPRLADLQALMGRVDCDTVDVERLASSEPGLLASLVSTSNSAYYRSPRSIGSLRDAIVRMGVRQSLAVLLERVMRDGFALPDARASAVLGGCWKNALLTARISRRLAEWYGGVSPDDAFLAGLLHNIGEITMLWRTLRSSPDPARTVIEVASRVVTHHESVGETVIRPWGLPPAVLRVTQSHHAPALGETPGETRLRLIVLAAWEESRCQQGDYLPVLHPPALPSPFDALPPGALERLRADGDCTD